MSMRKIYAKDLHLSQPIWWLASRFHFSFADYYNEDNTHFGVLRVMNDDIVQPTAGFGSHPHRDMEIVSYIVDGELSHKDSKGNAETLGRGSIQYMSAGTGIFHSEMNKSETTPVRFIQVWIEPDRRGYKPNYGSKTYDPEERHNKLLHIITSKAKANDKVIGFNQDSNFYVSELDAGTQIEFDVGSDRQAYLLCIEGKLNVNTQTLEERDAMEIHGGLKLALSAPQDSKAHLLLIEMQKEY